MSAPLPVACPGQDGGAWRVTLALISALAGAAAATWLVGMALHAFSRPPSSAGFGVHAASWAFDLAWVAPLAGVLCGVLIGAACLWCRPGATRPLVWDGQAWQWAGQTGRATVSVDLLDWMLVRFEPTLGAAVWLPLSEAGAGAAWPAIRAALYWPEPSAVEQIFRGQSTGSLS